MPAKMTRHPLCAKASSPRLDRAERAARRAIVRSALAPPSAPPQAPPSAPQPMPAPSSPPPRVPPPSDDEYPRDWDYKREVGFVKWFCLGACGWVDPTINEARIDKLLRIVDDMLNLSPEELKAEVKRMEREQNKCFIHRFNDHFAHLLYYYIQDAGRHMIDVLPMRVRPFEVQACWRAGEGWSVATGEQLLYIAYKLRAKSSDLTG